MMSDDQTDTEADIELFAREVVVYAFEESIIATSRDIDNFFAAPSDSPLAKVFTDKDESKRLKIICALAAERALAGFFSQMELSGLFEIKLIDRDENQIDLADEFGAPMNCAFFEDGWVASYSNYPSFLNQVEGRSDPNEDD